MDLNKLLNDLAAIFFKDIHKDEKMKPAIRIAAKIILFLIILIIGTFAWKYITNHPQNNLPQLSVDDKPSIDVKVIIEKLDSNSFCLSYNIINTGLSEARNVYKSLETNKNLFFTSYFVPPTPYVNIPAKSTITENVQINFPLKKDSTTILDITIGYVDTTNIPHTCTFRFLIPNNIIALKEYFPVGKKCSDGFPDTSQLYKVKQLMPWIYVPKYTNSNLPKIPQANIQFECRKDSTGTLYMKFTNDGDLPVIATHINIGMLSDSIPEEEINTHVSKLSGNFVSSILSKDRPLLLAGQKAPKAFLDFAEYGMSYISGYIIYNIIETGRTKRYTFEVRFYRMTEAKTIISKDTYID